VLRSPQLAFRYDDSMWGGRIVLAILVVAGCTKANPAKHCDDGTCIDPNYPFCDVSGAVAGEPGACIATACTANQFVECRGDVEVRCNAEGTNYNVATCERGCDAAANGCRLCDRGETACTNGQVARCDVSGVVMASELCTLGCFEDEPRCREIDPSNGLAAYFDMVQNPPDLDLANALFDTSTGEVSDNGQSISVPSFAVTAPIGGVPLRVFVVNSAKITQAWAGDPTSLSTGPGFVLLARGEIRISGQLGASSTGGSASELPGCSGGNGLLRTNCNYSASSGGGGGFATNGAKGGTIANNSEPGGAAGIASGNEKLIPLRGGCQGGRVDDSSGPILIRGGGGGGAMQLVSRTKIVVDGIINVKGGGGDGEEYDVGVYVIAGGGSGGAILLEAPSVILDVNGVLDATGGDGSDICFDLASFNCSLRGAGAKPGVAATAGVDIDCLSNGKATVSGSGGGGLGRIRINTVDGTYTKASSATEGGALTSGTIATR